MSDRLHCLCQRHAVHAGAIRPWLIWAATLSILICGALVAHIAESPLLAYALAQCAGIVAVGLILYELIKLTSAMPVRESDDNAD